MKTILLPTDFSANSKNAIRYAFEFCKGTACRFMLVQAYHVNYYPSDIVESIDDALATYKQQLQTLLDEMLAEFPEAKAFEFKVEAIPGFLSDVVNRLVERENPDMVIMGTKGASGLPEVLLGSNASGVINKTKCPVLLVPENATYRTPRHIVFASDQKAMHDIQHLNPMVAIADQFNATVHVVHVCEEHETHLVEKAIEGLKLNEFLDGVDHDYHVVDAYRAVEGLDQYLETHNADLLTMVTRENNFIQQIFHKSVTKQMALHTKVPLLALHD